MGILHDDEEDLRAELAKVTAERDAALERVKVVELRSAATPVDVERADEGDAIMRDFEEVAAMDPSAILKVVDLDRQAFLNAIANFNACARLEAQVRDLKQERDDLALVPCKACGVLGDPCALCGGSGHLVALTSRDVQAIVCRLVEFISFATAERDEALAALGRVCKAAESFRKMSATPNGIAVRNAILAAIGGKP